MLAEWIKPCERHLHWSAKSTFSGNGNVIRAKFKSFLSHVTNKHTDLDDPLFSKYVHGSLQPRKWLQVGTFSSLMRWDSIEKVQSANENSSVWLHVLYVGPKSSLLMFESVSICLSLGSAIYDRLYSALTNYALVKGIMQATPLAQTSCLEGVLFCTQPVCP